MNTPGPLTALPTLIRGDARALPLPDECVDLVVTSPPYFGLRDYGTDTQIGSEPTPAEFIAALIECTREMVRVLKPSGSIFVNLGDKYAGGGQGGNVGGNLGKARGGDPHLNLTNPAVARPVPSGMRAKSLMLLPERYRIAAVDELGLIARAVIVWCLSGGARVYARTATGDRPVMLRDLVRSYRAEDVQLWNGERWTQVLGWGRTPDDDGALEFELRTGERIGCTANHQWPTSRGLLRADEIRVGDVIETTRLPEPETPRTPALLPDEDIGWLVGLYIAEGSRSETTVQFAGHVDETIRHARLARIAEALDGTSAVYQTSENGATCNLHGSVIVGVIDRYVSAGSAKTKRLRHAAWQRSDAFLAAVVEGYLSGDGHFDAKNDRWRLGFTANDEWAADLRTLAARLGAVLKLRRSTHMMSGRSFPGWRGEWRWTRSTHHNAKADGEVVAIRRSRARDFYDLSVADEPNLFALASGVLTHNCKPNGLPESVTDRVRRSHEDWVHLVKQPKYFAAVDEIREPYSPNKPWGRRTLGEVDASRGDHGNADKIIDWRTSENPLGKLPGSVWEIATQPLRVPESLGVDHFACVDTETEILTRRGWLRHDQIKIGDEVAGYDMTSGITSWTPCSDVHRYDYDGDLVTADARGLSMRLTPNHRTLVHDHRGRHRTRGEVQVIEASALDKRHSIPRAVRWADDGREQGIGVAVAALCGWIAAEGWYQPTGNVHLSQSASVNPDKVADIDKLLASVPHMQRDAGDRGISFERGKYRARLRHSGRRVNLGAFATSDEAAAALTAERERLGIDGLLRTENVRVWKGREWVDVMWRLPRGFGDYIRQLMPDKLLTPAMADLPIDEARAMLDAFVDGDGSRRADGRISAFQKIRQNLDVLQVIAVRLGYNTTLKRDEANNRWVLYMNPPRPARLRRSDGTSLVGREHYKGTVWCVTTGTGTFVARRNGTVFVTGNSFPMEWPRRLILGWSSPGGVVLDPFSGTGTTSLVATMLGRRGIGVDLSADYQRLARWRCSDPKERARAAGLDPDAVARVARVPAGQQDLFASLTNPEEAA